MRQLPLGVRLQDRTSFASFLAGDNGLPLAAVQRTASGTGERCVWLHGPAGSGKSHLLQALCAAVPGSAYFPLAQLLASGPDVLEGAEQLTAVALDDLHVVAGDAGWERRLFALYNDCDAHATRLVIAARHPVTGLGVVLPDLRSRLASMPHFAMRPLDEAQQREALQRRAAQRGLELPDETVRYLQRRYARDMSSMQALLDRLDAASLEEQRRLTVPFIRQVAGEPP
jgi:DnaA family protein